MPEMAHAYSNDSDSNYSRSIPSINTGENVSQARRPVWSLQNSQNENASNESQLAFDPKILDDETWEKHVRWLEAVISNDDLLCEMANDRIQYGHPEHTQPVEHLSSQQSEQQGVVPQDVNALASIASRKSGETPKFNQVSVLTETKASNTTPQAPTETKKRRGRPLKEKERKYDPTKDSALLKRRRENMRVYKLKQTEMPAKYECVVKQIFNWINSNGTSNHQEIRAIFVAHNLNDMNTMSSNSTCTCNKNK